jgi:hypothetical protein
VCVCVCARVHCPRLMLTFFTTATFLTPNSHAYTKVLVERAHEKLANENVSTWQCVQRTVHCYYTTWQAQTLFGVLILCNFAVNIVKVASTSIMATATTNVSAASTNVSASEEMILPDSHQHVYEMFDNIFTLLFTVELAVNFVATWSSEFLADPWNYFDFAIVCVSLLTLALLPSLMPKSTTSVLKLVSTHTRTHTRTHTTTCVCV